ncbi:uncharacterized protein F5891DRAFT_1194033 [Suillus fuscotomentosus]|uniref:DUF6830 domain-containing protein n=1 Tax=Suillus fuscotomentosus TaxID=1912939 RepID=A0AAD4HHB4_9AGAM|nr:uncharacterized protein F5891DRAFT_1194033 [Suillus fuscotomentosus]KAG1895499.1 hypothetical protein F5891DRAFT_1194033 [Suillus fuscotomentosus]
MLKGHHAYHDPNDRPREVPEDKDEDEEDEDKQEEEAIDPDKQEPDDPQTALLEKMNHTRVTTDYFSKARQIITARDGAIPHPPRMFIAGGTAIHLNYTPSRTGVGVDDVATDFNILDLHVVLSEFLLCDTRERSSLYGGGSKKKAVDRPSSHPSI